MSWSLADMLYNDFGSEKEASDGDEGTCPLCDCLRRARIRRTTTPEGYDYLGGSGPNRPRIQRVCFHRACHQCSDTADDLLCARCKHMRLRHLTQCLLLAEPHAEEKVLMDDSGVGSTILDGISLSLGSVQDLEERSHYCDTCRLFSGRAREVMKQTESSPGTHCILELLRCIPGETLGGIECRFMFSLSLESSQKSLCMGAYFLN